MAKRKVYPVTVKGEEDSRFAVVYTEGTACPLTDCKHIIIPKGTLPQQRKYLKELLAVSFERLLVVGSQLSKAVLGTRFSEMDRAHGGLFNVDGRIVVPTYDAKTPHQVAFRKEDVRRWRSLEYKEPQYEEVSYVPNIPHKAVVFLDIETTSLEPSEGEHITSLQLLWEGETAYYIASPTKEMLDTLYLRLVEAEATVVAHNALFDFLWLSEKTGYNWFLGQFVVEDTMLFAHNRGCSPSNLKHLASYYTSENNPEAYQQEVGSFDKTYAVADVVATKAVYERLIKKGKTPIDNLSTRLLRVFGTIRYIGIALDRERLEEASQLGQERLVELGEQLSEVCPINWSSPKQVLKSLQSQGLKIDKTDVKTLEQHSEHPTVRLLLDYRKEEQMAKLFYSKYRGQEKGGRVYPTFLIGGTETGRTSCTSPNIQQANTTAKQMFVSRFDGGQIYRFDLDRNELCCAVFLSGDKQLAQALVQYDFHSYVASLVYEIPYDQVSKEQRKISKIATFGAMMYGGSAGGIARRTGTDKELIQKAVTALRGAFGDVVRFQDEQVHLGQSRLQLVDCYGKIRDLTLVKHYGYGDGSGNVRRVAMNTPVQALGGYICLELCSLIFEEMLKQRLGSVLVGQVHDSIYIDVKPGEEGIIEGIIKDAFLALNNLDTLTSLPGWGMVPVSGQLARGETMSDVGTEEVCNLSSWKA